MKINGVPELSGLRLRSEFDAVKTRGRRRMTALFILLVSPCEFGENAIRYGIICSRKFDKRAVKRNRARRLLREAVRKTAEAQSIPPCGMVLIPKRRILNSKMQDVLALLKESFRENGPSPEEKTSPSHEER